MHNKAREYLENSVYIESFEALISGKDSIARRGQDLEQVVVSFVLVRAVSWIVFFGRGNDPRIHTN